MSEHSAISSIDDPNNSTALLTAEIPPMNNAPTTATSPTIEKAPTIETLKISDTKTTFTVTNTQPDKMALHVHADNANSTKTYFFLDPIGDDEDSKTFTIDNKLTASDSNFSIDFAIVPKGSTLSPIRYFYGENKCAHKNIKLPMNENDTPIPQMTRVTLKSMLLLPSVFFEPPYTRVSTGNMEIRNRNSTRVAYSLDFTNTAFSVDEPKGYVAANTTISIEISRRACDNGLPETGDTIEVISTPVGEAEIYDWSTVQTNKFVESARLTMDTDFHNLLKICAQEWYKENEQLLFDKHNVTTHADDAANKSWKLANLSRFRKLYGTLDALAKKLEEPNPKHTQFHDSLARLVDQPELEVSEESNVPLSGEEETKAETTLNDTFACIQIEHRALETQFSSVEYNKAKTKWNGQYASQIPLWGRYIHGCLESVKTCAATPRETKVVKLKHKKFVTVLVWLGKDCDCCDAHCPGLL